MLRLFRLDYKSFWVDEIFSISISRAEIRYVLLDPMNPPLYYFILHIFMFFGINEITARLPSVIFGILSIPLIYKVGDSLFGQKIGLISSFLLSISAMHIYFSQEARTYALSTFFSLMSLFVCFSAAKRKDVNLWIIFAISSLIGALTHYYMLFIPIIGILFFAYTSLRDRSSIGRMNRILRKTKKRTLVLSLSAVIVCIVSFQFFLKALNLMGAGTAFLGWGLKPETFILDLFGPFSGGLFGPVIFEGNILPFILFFTFFLIGLYASFRRFKEQTVLLIMWIFFPTLVIFIFTIIFQSSIASVKYMMFILPAYIVAVSKGIDVFGNKIAGLLEKISSNQFLQLRRETTVILLIIVVFVGASIPSLQSYYALSSMGCDWRSVAQYLKTNVHAGDIIIIEPIISLGCLSYYYDANSLGITVTSIQDINEALPQNQSITSKELWFIYSIHTAIISDQTGEIKDWLQKSGFTPICMFQGIIVYHRPSPINNKCDEQVPLVAIHVSEYTRTKWLYSTWKYFQIYSLLEEALRSDGTPFVELSDKDIENGRLLTPQGLPKYPIFFSLAAECISSDEAAAIKNYVEAGGFVYVGSSSWTRNADGSPHFSESFQVPSKYTFWLSTEMGLDSLPTFQDLPRPELSDKEWLNSWSFVGNTGRGLLVDTTTSHRLVGHIPKGLRLSWILPERYDLCPTHNTTHLAWATITKSATVLATFEWTGPTTVNPEGYTNIPLIAFNPYGNGYFIYHSELAPLAGWGGFSVDSFEYTFFRKAIEWAFELNGAPLIRFAPWPYPKKAAFIARHDCCEPEGIQPMPTYVALEKEGGIQSEYYVVTDSVGVIDPATTLKQAKLDGAYIGSHSSSHISPDLQTETAALKNIVSSLDQLQTWLDGDRPKIWVSPWYGAIKESSLRAIQDSGVVSASEQGVGPFPHFAISMETKGLHYSFIELPTTEYFCTDAPYLPIMESLSFYTSSGDPNGTMSTAIDFIYDLGGLINIYSHFREGNLKRLAFYIEYTKTKPNVWFTNSEEIYNWWTKRDKIRITPTCEQNSSLIIKIDVLGPNDRGPFALHVMIPEAYRKTEPTVTVNGNVSTKYEITETGLSVSYESPSQVEITIEKAPTQLPLVETRGEMETSPHLLLKWIKTNIFSEWQLNTMTRIAIITEKKSHQKHHNIWENPLKRNVNNIAKI